MKQIHFFLYKYSFSLIEYATFFGAIQICRYLEREGIKMSESLLINSIHSQNAELIHLIEENFEKELKTSDKEELYQRFLEESIKCHHNDVSNYIIYNHLDKNKSHDFGIKYYNYAFIQSDHINEMSFFDFCNYEYLSFVKLFVTNSNININHRKIYFNEDYEICNQIIFITLFKLFK